MQKDIKDYVKGKASLDWVTYSSVELDEAANRCTGCSDLFYIGETIAELHLDKIILRFNVSCFQQVVTILSTFWESTQDQINGVKVRHN